MLHQLLLEHAEIIFGINLSLGILNFLLAGFMLMAFVKKRIITYLFLALNALSISFLTFYYSIFANGLIFSYPHWFRLDVILGLASSVLFYLIMESYSSSNQQYIKRKNLHLFVPLVAFVLLIPRYFASGVQKELWIQDFIFSMQHHHLNNTDVIIGIFTTILAFMYCIAPILKIRKMLKNKADMDAQNRDRIKGLSILGGATVLIFVLIVYPVFINFHYTSFGLVGMSLTLFFVSILYVLMFHPSILNEFKQIVQTVGEGVEHIQKKKWSPELLDQYEKKILHCVQSQHSIYLDPEMNISAFASATGLKVHHISKFLSVRMNTNFNNFINHYRVAYAMNCLVDPAYDHLSIDGIAEVSGFKSKTVFYRAFKLENNSTPTQYIKSHREMEMIAV